MQRLKPQNVVQKHSGVKLHEETIRAFKSKGYNSVSPYLIANGAQATIDFLVFTFNAKPLRAIGLRTIGKTSLL